MRPVRTGVPIGPILARMPRPAICIALLIAAPALAAPFEPYLGWATVGDPGNRAPTANEAPQFHPPFVPPNLQIGPVDAPYRITRTEVVIDQYMPFLDQYKHFHYESLQGSTLLGAFIFATDFNPDGTPNYAVNDIRRQVPIEIGFPVAQAYCNWLHNGQGQTLEDFTTGAYDLRDFFADPSDRDLVPVLHEPDAKYWIPTLDELTKAAFWDPQKDGVGGYWKYGISSDEPPIYALPENGGQSSAATDAILPAGSYPDAVSPWGLLDVSGTYPEWSSGVELDTALIA